MLPRRAYPGLSAAARAPAREDEAAWIERTLAGEPEAFAPVVERYQARLYNLCYRLLGRRTEAQDAAQEAFLRAYDALRRFDRSRPLAAWLVEIAVNVCRDRRRAAWWKHVVFGSEPGADEAAPAPAADQALTRAETLRALVAALQELRPADREALAVLGEELPTAEAARALGITTNALYVRQNRARARLATLLRERYPELFDEDGAG